jgi:hypothetical protein
LRSAPIDLLAHRGFVQSGFNDAPHPSARRRRCRGASLSRLPDSSYPVSGLGDFVTAALVELVRHPFHNGQQGVARSYDPPTDLAIRPVLRMQQSRSHGP